MSNRPQPGHPLSPNRRVFMRTGASLAALIGAGCMGPRVLWSQPEEAPP